MKLIDLALPYQKDVIMDSSKVKALNFSRQIGKSWTAAFLATKKCLSRPNSLVLYLSTGMRAASEALKTCMKFGEAIMSLSRKSITYSANSTCLTFSNGSRIMSLPGRPESCRGWTADLLICDEMAFWQNPEDTWQAIVPTILNPLTGKNKEIIVCSTPLAKNSLFYDLCQRAKTEPNWRYFQTTVHQAKAAGLDVDIEELHKMIPDPYQFASEFECQFADQVNALVPIDELEFVDLPTTERFDETFMGIDIARSSDGTAIVVIGRKADKLKLIHLTVLHNVDYKRQIEVMKRIYSTYQPRLAYGDATGLGGPIMEELNRYTSANIKPFNFNHKNKNEAYEYLRKNVFDRRISFCSEYKDQIIEDMLLISQTIDDKGNVAYQASRRNNSHADIISATILALQAERESRQIQSGLWGINPISTFY